MLLRSTCLLALLLALGGCEIVADFDRSMIPEPDAGAMLDAAAPIDAASPIDSAAPDEDAGSVPTPVPDLDAGDEDGG